MKVKTLKGRDYYWKPNKIDWEADSLSKFQKDCKNILAMYWLGDIVAEEQMLPGTKMHFDFVNFTKKIILECDGPQHQAFNPFFHKKNIFNFVGGLKRDEQKNKFAELNGFIMVRVKTPVELSQYMLMSN